MQHLLLLYLIMSIIPGIAALTVLSSLAARFRVRALTYYLIAYSSFTVSILINLTMFYSGINISEEISFGVYVLLALGIPFSILMHTMLPLAANEVADPPGKRLIDLIIILIAVTELVLFCTPLLMEYSRDSQTIIFGPIFPLSSIIEMLSIGYSIAVIIILRKNITDTAARRYILILMITIAVFLPAIGYDQFFFFGVSSITSIPIEIILSPLFYMVLSLATVISGGRILKDLRRAESTGNQPAREPDQKPLETRIQELAAQAGLSERETMLIPLISEGLGNKQIALELHISTKTVGNHIYNIYRKLDISSRYELLALLK